MPPSVRHLAHPPLPLILTTMYRLAPRSFRVISDFATSASSRVGPRRPPEGRTQGDNPVSQARVERANLFDVRHRSILVPEDVMHDASVARCTLAHAFNLSITGCISTSHLCPCVRGDLSISLLVLLFPVYSHEFMHGRTDTRAPLRRPIIRIISTQSRPCHRHAHSYRCARRDSRITRDVLPARLLSLVLMIRPVIRNVICTIIFTSQIGLE